MRILLILLMALSIFACCKDADVPTNIKKLYSSSATDRNDAALALADCRGKPGIDKAVTKLIALLYDPNVGVQSAAAYALRRIDTPEAEAALEKATKKR